MTLKRIARHLRTPEEIRERLNKVKGFIGIDKLHYNHRDPSEDLFALLVASHNEGISLRPEEIVSIFFNVESLGDYKKIIVCLSDKPAFLIVGNEIAEITHFQSQENETICFLFEDKEVPNNNTTKLAGETEIRPSVFDEGLDDYLDRVDRIAREFLTFVGEDLTKYQHEQPYSGSKEMVIARGADEIEKTITDALDRALGVERNYMIKTGTDSLREKLVYEKYRFSLELADKYFKRFNEDISNETVWFTEPDSKAVFQAPFIEGYHRAWAISKNVYGGRMSVLTETANGGFYHHRNIRVAWKDGYCKLVSKSDPVPVADMAAFIEDLLDRKDNFDLMENL